MRRALLALAVSLAASAATAGAALADGRSVSGMMYQAPELCVFGFDNFGHGDGWGWADVYVDSSTADPWWLGGSHCALRFNRPAGYLAAQWQLWKWRGDLGQWVTCNYSGWQYNGSTSHHFSISKTFASYNVCNAAYYGIMGGGYVYNNGWYGGWLWTGYHWLPA